NGTYKQLSECLLPGAVIPSGSPDDEDFVVDEDFHHDDMATLRQLGMSDVPTPDVDPSSTAWFEQYKSSVIDLYYKSIPPGDRRPQQGKIMVTGAKPAGHLGLLLGLTPAARSRFIQHLPSTGIVTNWSVYALTRPDDAPLLVQS